MLTAVWMLGMALAFAADAPGGLVDPTRPADYAGAAAQTRPLTDELAELRLNAIRISGAGNSAVLNGRIVRAGENLGRARVVDVRPGVVIVELDHRQTELRLAGPEFKKPTTQRKSGRSSQ